MSQQKEKRITDMPDFHYNEKVLIGNWVEDQQEYIRQVNPLYSVYMNDFKTPENTLDKDSFWKIRYHGNGVPLSHLFGYGKREEDFKNQATIYDLAYHHKLKDQIRKTYGIVTGTGHRDYKKIKWEDDKKLNTYETTYRNCFNMYPIECLKIHHKKEYKCVDYIIEKGKYDQCVFPKHKPTKIVPAL